MPTRSAGTALHDVEEALRASEMRYRQLFDSTSDCLFFVDVTLDGRFRFAGFNPAAERSVGLTSSETMGKLVEEVLPDAAREVTANYRRCLEAGTLIGYEAELQFPAGTRCFE